MSKKIYLSQTVQFFTTILTLGGLDLITTWAEHGDVSWRSVMLLVCGLVGIVLRMKTTQPVSM